MWRTSYGEGACAAFEVKSKLDGLITELNTVRTDVGNGSVPASTVSALNTAANAADSAC